MPETEIYLIRHGVPEYEYGPNGEALMYEPEAPLSKEGRQQVSSLSKKLPPLDVIYTSPFVRTVETAEILADELGNPAIIESEALSDNFLINSKGRLLRDVVDRKIEPHPDDETIEGTYNRITNAFKDIFEKEKGKKVGVVCHGDPIRFIIWKYVEKRPPLKEASPDLTNKNFPNQGEAWALIFDESGELTNSYLITRDDNENPGVGQWQYAKP